jgi:hypothetical protein
MHNNKFLNLLKYNAYIFIKTKQIIIFTLIILLCLGAFLYVSLKTDFSSNDISRETEIENMKETILLDEFVLEDAVLDSGFIEQTNREIYLYNYLLENNYVCSDFYSIEWSTSISNFYNYTSKYKTSTLMLYSIEYSGAFLFIVGVFMGLFLFGDFYKKNIKNILSSGITKKSFFYTNYLFGIFFITLMFVICFFIGWFIGGIKNTGKIIYRESGSYIIKNIVNIYNWAMFGRFILAILVYSLNVLIARIMNNKKTLIICTLLLTIIILVSELSLVISLNYDVLSPIVSLYKNNLGITKNSIISLSYHFLCCVALMILAEKHFEKRDYYDRT